MNSELRNKVLEQKSLASKNQRLKNLKLLYGVVAGVMFAIGWFVMTPMASTSPIQKLLIGVFFGTILGLFLISRLKTKAAACPVCGFSWEIEESHYTPPDAVMTNWSKCPGCGCSMSVNAEIE